MGWTAVSVLEKKGLCRLRVTLQPSFTFVKAPAHVVQTQLVKSVLLFAKDHSL